MKNITLKQALATPCKKCHILPVIGDDWRYNGGLCMIRCPKCGKESQSGCRRRYATNSWYLMNKETEEVQNERG